MVAAILVVHVDAVLVADDLPEFGAELVAALAHLDVDNLIHDSAPTSLASCAAQVRSRQPQMEIDQKLSKSRNAW